MKPADMTTVFSDFVSSEDSRPTFPKAKIFDAGQYRGSIKSYQLKNVSSLKKDGTRNLWAAGDVYRVVIDISTPEGDSPFFVDMSEVVVKNRNGFLMEPTQLAVTLCKLSGTKRLVNALEAMTGKSLNLKLTVSQATGQYPAKNWLTIGAVKS
jgi:hypothetical protein